MTADDRPDPDLTGAYTPQPVGAVERFAPGQLLADRYRIVAALGRGGMGEVYRADDLTLGQPVALKFLPPHLAQDPDRLTRFRKEVAAARKVSHPHVCRVYDIADHEGQSFLTMEYVDGEDLSSLVRRVGRLPEEKGVEIARQLCGALAAIHDQGLLHRDLKPANVMLDGRGRVKLTDFGLAAAAGDLSAAADRSGTPLYMAPEQLAGSGVTARSDLFALGLVLYEVFTGKRAFAGANRDTPPSKPTSHVSGLSPAVERVILKCLEIDPGDRPRSVADVLAALPGGDPLAAAVAAGETPAPRLVADAGGSGVISLRLGLIGFGVVVASLLVVALAVDRTGLHRLASITTPPEEMSGRARQVLADVGYPDTPAHIAGHYEPNWQCIRAISKTDADWSQHASGRPGAFAFLYRGSSEPILPILSPKDSQPVPKLTWSNPPRLLPGDTAVRLDRRGRLLELHFVPAADATADPTTSGDGWSGPLFVAAGLDRGQFAAAEPGMVPPGPCDRQAAWAGTWGDGLETRVRVEAAAYRGRPVWFRIESEELPAEADRPPREVPSWGWAFFLSVLALATALAVRNLRRGRGDRTTAGRLAVLLFGWVVLSDLADRHNTGLRIGLSALSPAIGAAVVVGGVGALAYLALEPAVRRRWPWRLTAWTRLFAGRWRDPMVGRDLLIGMAAAAIVQAALLAYDWVAAAAGGPAPIQIVSAQRVDVPPVTVGQLLIGLGAVVVSPVMQLFLSFCIFLIVRRERIAWPAYAALVIFMQLATLVPHLSGGILAVIVVRVVILVAGMTFLMARFGLLASAGWMLVTNMVNLMPLTVETGAWYFPQVAIGIGVLVVVAAFCTWTATGARLPSAGRLLGDE
jgi:eukaryotic-like serine/threonine-protein kinase